ncbi:CRISPR-associated protein Cas5 [Methanococcoides burtonii]|uniref:CRISPR-associated protein Cas5, Hmari subtype n=1 Tax=Methanococcoides burtonii (strain DSM 6242 / NBRC 107633 / OCM 468 / ACE-M) TaxID=259564 RepID=Q12WX6_METBU|nr:CRISPR-associated protein Cas5 [Methanococcoides burtonii]ABE52050.1 CRISPR-associated protein Cas5, Hmari subtype [Methanococcoides burtonii DSM 6242]
MAASKLIQANTMDTTIESFSSFEENIAQSEKLLTFRLYGSFAHFNQPISNRFRNTYSIIPKPQLLGLIGSIVGLSGYKNAAVSPEFYSKLSDLKVFIKCNSLSEKKFTLSYNSLNSFLNNRIDSGSPNVIIKEQVLLDPDYEVGIVVNENNPLHLEIIDKIRMNCGVFPIYFGKNEFFANVQFGHLKDFEYDNSESNKCCSIFPFEEVESVNTRNMKLELLPVDFDDMFKYIYRLMAIPSEKCNVSLKNSDNYIASEGSVYYVF